MLRACHARFNAESGRLREMNTDRKDNVMNREYRGGRSRADAAHLAEEARASAAAAASAAADREKLEREAPIRGLAKYVCRFLAV